MNQVEISNSLSQRLRGQHLLISIIGLFTFVGLVVAICWPIPRIDLVAASAVASCAVFFLGSNLIQRSVAWHSQLESQLSQFANEGVDIWELSAIPATTSHANGWNQLLARVQQQEVWNGVERRLSETINAQQVKRWEAIFQQLADGVVLCDNHGAIVESNGAFSNMVRSSNIKELSGQSLLDSVRPIVKDSDSLIAWERMLSGPANQVSEVRLNERVEEGVWRVSMKRTNLDSLGPGATIWTVRDITQSRLAEHAREQFVATATHELRTPLANIRAYAETLSTATELEVEQQLDFFNIINNEATRLSRFVDELLNVSQMEAGAITVQKHDVYLDRLLMELVEQQRPLSVEKGQNLELLAPPKIPRIRGDKDKLAGAISNLIGNAIKYTPDGGEVKVRVEYDPSQVYIHVEDNGFGISEQDVAKLGNKFYRSSDERVQNVSGNGLGLAFVQEVARLHGGRLSIRSELNVGSSFTLEIPNG
jgi:two-component system phosphate regulon sensor histidine kinase PhoR